MDRFTDPNDPLDRRVETTNVVSTSSDSGVTWFIVGALVIAAGVLAYLYFGDDTNTTADATTPSAIEAPAETGRASTPANPAEAPTTMSPGAPAAPAEPTPSAPSPAN